MSLLKNQISNYRETLLNKEETLECARFYIQEATKKQEERIASGEQPPTDPDFWIPFFQKALEYDTFSNINHVFLYSESPIETIFLNSLILSFVITQPLALIVTPPPVRDFLVSIKQFRENHQAITTLWEHFKEVSPENPFDSFAEYVHQKFSEETSNYYLKHISRYLVVPFAYNFYHLTMQARFPSFRINGKSIRTDILIWIPANDFFKLVVECDGFQYHSKDTFTSDRKRDRLFHREGYEVLRYSGSEIYKDPLDVSWDLLTYLDKRLVLQDHIGEI